MRYYPVVVLLAVLVAACPGRAAVPVVLEPPAATAAAAHPDDIVVLRTDFEQDPAAAGWTAAETPKGATEPAPLPLEWTTAQAHSGARSLTAARGTILSALMPAKPCVVYRLRFWGRIAPAPESKPSTRMQGKWGLRFYDQQGRIAWETIYCGAFAAADWQRYGAKIMCPFWTNRVRVAFWPEGGAQMYVDDVELVEDAVANAFDKETPPPISYRPEPDR
ncbi:MAG TPA: hypothetical protein PLZ36_07295, partial [Armatimonadota bacterium]|nr:hypothetical protein [Armatimonadota bacterium]